MKRQVYTSDWAYDDNQQMNAFKEVMAANMDHQDDGEVGIFWYDPEEDDVFGVKSASVDDVPYYNSDIFRGCRVKTCRPLHYKVWDRERHRGKDPRFSGNYTKVPRGRVFYVEGRGFVVVVGSWINEFPEAKEAIKSEFNLPNDVDFEINSHWDIGHGLSDKFGFEV